VHTKTHRKSNLVYTLGHMAEFFFKAWILIQKIMMT